jgi:hypothetical protein
MRSQSWNTSIAVTEAGIEEALQHLNASYTNLSTDGWTAAGSSTYVMSRALSSSARYTVTIDASSINKPVITSQAYITPTSLGFAAPATMFAVGRLPRFEPRRARDGGTQQPLSQGAGGQARHHHARQRRHDGQF